MKEAQPAWRLRDSESTKRKRASTALSKTSRCSATSRPDGVGAENSAFTPRAGTRGVARRGDRAGGLREACRGRARAEPSQAVGIVPALGAGGPIDRFSPPLNERRCSWAPVLPDIRPDDLIARSEVGGRPAAETMSGPPVPPRERTPARRLRIERPSYDQTARAKRRAAARRSRREAADAVREPRSNRPAGLPGVPRDDELRQRQRQGLGARRGRCGADRAGGGGGRGDVLRHRRYLLRGSERGGHRAAARQAAEP